MNIQRRLIRLALRFAIKFGLLKANSCAYLNLKYIGLKQLRPFPFNNVLNFAKSLIPIETKNNWLDSGCGFGEFTSLIKRSFPNLTVVGIDFSIIAIKKAKKYYPQCSFKVNTIYNTEFPDNHFEIVSILEVLEHLENPSLALKEIFRITKPKGYIIITVPFKGVISHEHIISFDQNKLVSFLPFQPSSLHFGFAKSRFDKILIAVLKLPPQKKNKSFI